MAAEEWVSDDSSLKHEEFIYRRVAKADKGSFNLTVDRKSGEKCLGKGAFSPNDNDRKPPAGCSVHLDSLLRAHEIPTSRLVANWDTHGVGRFRAADVRRNGGGVIVSPDNDDTVLGPAHALLRTKSPGLPRTEWSYIRSAILDEAVYFDSDPGYAEG